MAHSLSMWVQRFITYRIENLAVNLFNEDSYKYLNRWNASQWFCDCNYNASVFAWLNNNASLTQADCNANPTTAKVCNRTQDSGIAEVCHLARKKRSTDRHTHHATRTNSFASKMVSYDDCRKCVLIFSPTIKFTFVPQLLTVLLKHA